MRLFDRSTPARHIIKVHRSGMIYIVVSIVMGVLSINSGNNFHYLTTAAMLGFMLASGISGRHNIRGAEITCELPDEIYAGTPFLLSVEVKNRNRCAPIYLIELNIGGSDVMFPVVAAGGVSRAAIAYSLPERGRHQIGYMELRSVYPFNLFTRFWPLDGDLEAVVFPKPAEPAGEKIYLPMENEEGLSPDIGGSEDIVGVRPYVEGDSMRRVHWKSSARTGKLSSRVYDEPRRGGKVIDLEGLMAFGKERALSLAAGVIRESLVSGEAIGISGGENSFPVSSSRVDKLAMLERLALL